jgi:hypothetical protein
VPVVSYTAAHHHCGFNLEKSFGATIFLIAWPESSILMGSPRSGSFLTKPIQSLGGAKYMALSHMCVVSLSASIERFQSHPQLLIIIAPPAFTRRALMPQVS